MCRLLIRIGKAAVYLVSFSAHTPPYLAAQNGHAAACRVLIIEGKVDVIRSDRAGNTAMNMASHRRLHSGQGQH